MATRVRQFRLLANHKWFANVAPILDDEASVKTAALGGLLQSDGSLEFKSRFSSKTARHPTAWAISILGCSVAALWMSSELAHAEELGTSSFVSNNMNESQLVVDELNVSKQGEVKSNAHTARWRIFTDRARNLSSQGLFDEAEKYFSQALEEAKKGFGDEDPHVASSYNNLAELFRMKKEYDKAEPFYLEAVERLKRGLGAEHESVGFALHNVAGFYLLQRKLELAREYYEGALKIKGRMLGLDHPEYANTMYHLAEVLRLQGNLNDAVALFRDSIRILEEVGLGHTSTAVKRMNRLSEILVFSNQFEEAAALQRKIVRILEVSKGYDSLDMANAMDSLAITLQRQGKLKECEELLGRCVDILKKIFGANHIRVAAASSKLGGVALQHGDKVASVDKVLALAEYEKARGSLLDAVRIAEPVWKDISAGKGTLHTRRWNTHAEVDLFPLPSFFLSLVGSLITLGVLGIHKLQLITDSESSVKTLKDAEEALRHALALLQDKHIQQDLGSSLEVKRLHMECVLHLAELLNKKRQPEGKQDEEVQLLLKEASAIKADLQMKTER